MDISRESKVGEVVAQDYRAASVFKSYGIDFCCGGGNSIGEVCAKKELDPQMLTRQLEEALSEKNEGVQDFNSWDLDLLVDYIEKKHHRYVEQKVPEILAYLRKLVKVHGERHPELKEIEMLFSGAAVALKAHMQKEEQILFPFVRQIAARSEGGIDAPHFGTVENPIAVMEEEHENEGKRFRRIAELSGDYTAPDDGCTTYRVAFAMLEEFEKDLHQHIHLENNILFPKAIEAGKAMSIA